jgi:transposase
MSRFRSYPPEQAYLLPPSVADVLGADHLCFFIHAMVERLNLRAFREAYGEEGGLLYDPALMLKVWLYAYALGITSARRLEQRVREDLAFRYLAGGAAPDHWALSAFRRRHARGLNDAFTQVLEFARAQGLGRLGTVAIDSTRIKAAAAEGRVDVVQRRRDQRAHLRRKVRHWQQQCNAADPNEGAGMAVPLPPSLPAALPPLQKLRRSRTDPDARFLRARGRFVLGYSGELAVSEDHLIVAARVTQQASDNASLVPMVEAIERQCRARPQRVLADSGFYSNQNVAALEQRGIELYAPDSCLARALNTGEPLRDGNHRGRFAPELRRMRRRLRSREGRRRYRQRKAIVEPVFGVLKEQRGMRSFRLRGLANVNLELTWAALSYNLTRLYAQR